MEMKGFSIREYASRMRSVNVVKCWPFDDSTGEDTIKSLLPPISIKKFSWWLDELEYLHPKSQAKNVGNSKMKKKKKKKPFLERGESSSRRSEIDFEQRSSGLVKAKGKVKAPKKRPIVEIFAVAPRVERVMSSDEEEEKEERNGSFYSSSSPEEINWGLKGKRNENNKKKKIKKYKPTVFTKLEQVKKKKKKKICNNMDLSIADKENHIESELQTQVKAVESRSSSYSTKESEIYIRDCVSGLKRKSRLQHFDINKRTRPRKTLNWWPTGNDNPVHGQGSSKNDTKSFSLQQSTEPETAQLNQHRSKQKADKHLSSLENYDIHVSRSKPSVAEECFKFHAQGLGKGSINLEKSGCLDISNRIENKLVSVHAREEQLPIPHMKQPSKVESFSRLVTSDKLRMHDTNRQIFDSGCGEVTQNPMYFNSPSAAGIRNSSSSTCGSLVKDLGTPQVCFTDYQKTYNELSISHPSDLEERSKRMPQTSSHCTTADKTHVSQFENFPHFSPKELLSTLWSLPNGNQTGLIYGEKSINSFNENFVGLPLNSHGELMTLSSNAKSQFDKMSSAISKYFGNQLDSGNCGIFSNDQLKICPVEGYVKENPEVVIPTRLDISKFQSNGRKNLDMNFQNLNDRFFLLGNFNGKEEPQVHLRPEVDQNTQPRMRLMGKDFVVSGKGFHGIENGHIWKDKQVLEELHSGLRNLMINESNEPSVRKHQETSFSPSENQINCRSGSTHVIPPPDCAMHQNVFSPRNFSTIYDTNSLLSSPFLKGYESHAFGAEHTTATVSNKNSSPNMNSSPAQLRNKQNLPHASRSAIRFPFMHPDLQGHVQSTRDQTSFVNMSSSLFEGSLKETSTRESYRNLGGSHYQYVMPPTNQWTDPSISLMPKRFCTYSPFSIVSNSQNSALTQIHSALTQHPINAFYHEAVHMSAVHRAPENQKQSDRNKSGIGISRFDHSKKSVRRNSTASSVPSEPSKRIQEGSQCAVTESTNCINSEGDFQNTQRAFESFLATKNLRTVRWGEYGADKGEQRFNPWVDPYSTAARPGPLKLTPGGKHILKACQQIDHSGSHSTNPDIPLYATTQGSGFRRLLLE